MDSELEEQSSSYVYSEISRDEMKKAVVTAFHTAYKKLEELWEEIGFRPENRHKRSHTVLYHLKVLLNQIVEEEEGRLKRLISNLESYSAELIKLSDELSIPPFEPDEHTPLIELEKIIKSKADELTREKSLRMETLLELKEQEKKILMTMDVPPYSLSSTDVPSGEQLRELGQHLVMLKDEKQRRMKKYQALKATIQEAMNNLGHVPQSPLEKEVAYAPDEDVLLTEKNMNKMKVLSDQLEQSCKINEELAEDIRRKLSILWQCLKVDVADRETCLKNHSGYKSSTIESLQQELQHCEQLKKENMKSFVENSREQLKELWEKCYVSEEQINQFTAYFDDNCTEELLGQHEAEINKWQNYWNRFHELFLGIEKLRQLWQQIKIFEKKASDPIRFANRGGALLKEEKERKKLIRSLPEVEERLKKLALEWEIQEGEEFLVHGKRLPDFLAYCWEEHNKEKENEKNLRQKKKQEEENRTYVSFAPKRALTPGTPLIQSSIAKRPKYTASRTQTPVGMVFRTPAMALQKSPRFKKNSPTRTPFRPICNDNAQAPATDIIDCASFVSIASYTDFKKGLDLGKDAILNSTTISSKK